MIEIKILQELSYRISARLVRACSKNMEQSIMESLEEIGEKLGADRVGIIGLEEDSVMARILYAWYSSGASVVSTEMNLAAHFPWAYEVMFRRGQVHSVPRLSDLPPQGRVDRVSHESIGTKTLLGVPLATGGQFFYILVLNATRVERNWPEEIVPVIRMIGDMLVCALQRRKSEITLRTLLERQYLAANSADVGLWEYYPKTEHFWVTDKVQEHFGLPPTPYVSRDAFIHRIHPEDKAKVLGALQELMETEKDVAVEYRLQDQDGSIRWMFSQGRVVRIESQDGPRHMGVTLDVTARKSIELKLEAKVCEVEELRLKLEKENEFLRYEAAVNPDQAEVLGSCEKMRALMNQVHQVARTGSTVLLTGETGTGKGLIAQTIHRLSDRARRVMVKVNCAALPGALVESELFGREKGAFTGALSKQKGRFEIADGSTLFLDEIAEMPLETQAKLLRVLQDGEFERLGSPHTIKVDVRLIAATNRDLEEEVRCGRFRRDLYYRLNVFPIHVPPLRERIEDIPQLVWEFVGEFGERMGKKMRRISARDMSALQSYPWPGNIRELRNVIEHSLIVSQGDTLEVQRLSPGPQTSEVPKSLDEMELEHIQLVLRATRGRIKGAQGAAAILKMNPSTLYSRMRKLGIPKQFT